MHFARTLSLATALRAMVYDAKDEPILRKLKHNQFRVYKDEL